MNKNILEELLNNETLYEAALSMDTSKTTELILNAKSKEEKEFYHKFYNLILQTKQTILVKKGVF